MLITPERFIALKAAVKAECQRRNGTGSVAQYAGTAYDYTVTPAAGKTIKQEHYTKNAVPINAIDGSTPTSGARIVSATELSAMESKISTLAAKNNWTSTQAETGCASSCTGLCWGGCNNTCSSCRGSCWGDCEGTCSGGCNTTCTGGCDTGCFGSCVGSCRGTCTAYCVEYCEDGCSTACAAQCNASCTSENYSNA